MVKNFRKDRGIWLLMKMKKLLSNWTALTLLFDDYGVVNQSISPFSSPSFSFVWHPEETQKRK